MSSIQRLSGFLSTTMPVDSSYALTSSAHGGLVLAVAECLRLQFFTHGQCVVLEGGWDTEMYFIAGEEDMCHLPQCMEAAADRSRVHNVAACKHADAIWRPCPCATDGSLEIYQYASNERANAALQRSGALESVLEPAADPVIDKAMGPASPVDAGGRHADADALAGQGDSADVASEEDQVDESDPEPFAWRPLPPGSLQVRYDTVGLGCRLLGSVMKRRMGQGMGVQGPAAQGLAAQRMLAVPHLAVPRHHLTRT